jgi:uncharacterized protein YbjT (DUF2867 family)
MASKKVIAVVGATGAQGGGLARAILADPGGGFAVRALTRQAQSDKAKSLAAAGAEVVSADLDDETSLQRAFEDAHGAYLVTNFWEHFSPDREKAQAAAMARAAKAVGLEHAIWSTLEDSRRFVPLSDSRMPTLMGQYKVPHFDAKAEADQFFVDAGVPTTFLLTSFYWDNLIYFGMGPKPGPDGRLLWTMPLGTAKSGHQRRGHWTLCLWSLQARHATDGPVCRYRRRTPDGRGDGRSARSGAWAARSLPRHHACAVPWIRLSRC